MADENLPPRIRRGKNVLFVVACRVCGQGRPVRRGREHQPCKACIQSVLHPDKVASHPLYLVWGSMVRRCTNPNDPAYPDYGGRDIGVCWEWRHNSAGFIAWAVAAGWRPGLQIDRIDNDAGYSPENCRFGTRSENMRNTRMTRLTVDKVARIKRLLADGIRPVEIGPLYGVSRQVIYQIKKGKNWADVLPEGGS